MNKNQIITRDFSNPESAKKYDSNWEDEPEIREKFYENGLQCGGCSFFAPFDSDWGLCCHDQSRHYLETVFEHFTCPQHVNEGWDSHSFVSPKTNPHMMGIIERQFEVPQAIYEEAKRIAQATNREPYMVI